jgi:peptidoglycan/xylan/chitin deacetylase (PgdA/CDA1 family)/SAM-dependent methyltransferase
MKTFLLTFDVEEFDIPRDYNIKESLNQMCKPSQEGLKQILDLLKKEKIKATFFTTYVFAENSKELIRRIVNEDHELALHGHSHKDDYSKMEEEKAIILLKKAKDSMEKIFKTKIYGYRGSQFRRPSYSLLKKIGLEYDSSSHPTFVTALHPKYGRKQFKDFFSTRKIHEANNLVVIPVSVTPLVRLPLSWIWFRNMWLIYTKIVVSLSFLGKDFLNIYFHPWEFANIDLIQYRRIWSLIRRKTGKINLIKLKKLIVWCKKNNFKFDTMHSSIKLLKKEKIVNRFDKVAKNYIINRERGVIGTLFEKQKEKLLELLDIKNNERILDAGCGPGTYSLKIKELGGKPYGIDLSENMIKEAKNNGLKAEVANLQNYRSKTKFDKILVGSSMEFVSDVESTLRNLKNNLKKNGVLVFDVPHYSFFGVLYYFYYRLKGININVLSKKQLKRLLNGSGFKIEKIERAGLISFGVKSNVHE